MRLSDSVSGGISFLIKFITLLIGLVLVKTQLDYLGIAHFGKWTNVATLMGVALILDPGKANAIRKEISLKGISESKKSFIGVIYYYRNLAFLLLILIAIFWQNILSVDYLKYVVIFLPFIFLFKIVNVIFLSTQKSYVIYLIELAIILSQLILWVYILQIGSETLILYHFFIPVLIYFFVIVYQCKLIDINFLSLVLSVNKNYLRSDPSHKRYFYMQLWYVVSVYGPLWFVYFAQRQPDQFGFTYKMYLILYGLSMAIISPLWSRISENILKDKSYQLKFFKKTVLFSVVITIIWMITTPVHFMVLSKIETDFVPGKLDLAISFQFAILSLIQVPIVFMAGGGLQKAQSSLILTSVLMFLLILTSVFIKIELLFTYVLIDVSLIIVYFTLLRNAYKGIKIR